MREGNFLKKVTRRYMSKSNIYIYIYMHFYILQCMWINMWSSRVVFSILWYSNFHKICMRKTKKSKVFPIFVKMKNIGDYNEFVQIMGTNYWIFFWYFIFIHYTNYLENKSYHMDVVTLTCIISSHNHYFILCISNCKKKKNRIYFYAMLFLLY
jgi:hypothetical protein